MQGAPTEAVLTAQSLGQQPCGREPVRGNEHAHRGGSAPPRSRPPRRAQAVTVIVSPAICAAKYSRNSTTNVAARSPELRTAAQRPTSRGSSAPAPRGRAAGRSADTRRGSSRRASRAPRAGARGRKPSSACRREAAERPQRLAADMLVDGLHRLPGAIGLLLRAVRDQVERAERADEPAPEVGPEIGVLDDACRDERMRDLEQHRRPAAEERGQRGVADSPDRALGREVPVPAREPVGVRAPCGCSRSTSPHAHTVPFSASLGEMQGAQLKTTGARLDRVGDHACRPRRLGDRRRRLRMELGHAGGRGLDRRDPPRARARRELDRHRGPVRLRPLGGGRRPGDRTASTSGRSSSPRADSPRGPAARRSTT